MQFKKSLTNINEFLFKLQILCILLLACTWAAAEGQLNRLKVPRHRVGSSKFSLNPLKPLMNLMRQDPMKAAAQRHYPKYLPPPPGMLQAMSHPARTSTSPYGGHPYRPYPSHHTRFLPPSTISLMPPYMASSHAYPTYYSDPHQYRLQPSELQYKAVRIPSRTRRPAASVDSLNIADSVVRQLLDMSHRQTSENNPHPSVLVIEDPDITSSASSSSSGQQDIFSDSMSHQSPQKVMLSPPVHAEYSSDSSADMSSSSLIGNSASGNPEVFVIVSKNKSKNNNNNYFLDDKKSEILSSSGSSSKLKKYKITSSYDENGDRQVWIIK